MFKETKTKTPNSIYSKRGRLQQALQMQEMTWHVTESHRPYVSTPITHQTPRCCSAPGTIKGVSLHRAGRDNVKEAEHKATLSCPQQML